MTTLRLPAAEDLGALATLMGSTAQEVQLERRGVETVALSVDAASPTGALRLYERVGMHVVERLDTYEREIA